MLGQAQSRGQVLDGIKQHGVAPGGRKMIDWEEEAAEEAIRTGIYGVYRNTETGKDCSRVGPSSKCFCGHRYSEHSFTTSKAVYPRCGSCTCQAFRFIPQRPEEVGDWWLVRRKGFNVHTWRAKCRCGHSHEEHDPVRKRCRCGCGMFQSNFACLACDKLWEAHETVFETTMERATSGRTVGEAFRPLSDDSAAREAVFPGEAQDRPGAHKAASASSFAPNKLRPAQVSRERAEKSVQIMHESSGGVIRGQDVVNRWGRVEAPPKEWLYQGGGPDYSERDSNEQLQQQEPPPRAGRLKGRLEQAISSSRAGEGKSGAMVTNTVAQGAPAMGSREKVPSRSSAVGIGAQGMTGAQGSGAGGSSGQGRGRGMGSGIASGRGDGGLNVGGGGLRAQLAALRQQYLGDDDGTGDG